MTLDIDRDMNIRVAERGAEPMVFIPDVELYDIAAPSIIDDF